MSTVTVSLAGILPTLTRERLFDLARVFGYQLRATRADKATVVATLAERLDDDRLADVLEELGRDDRAICRAHDLDADDRNRDTLIDRILHAAGIDPSTARRRAPKPRRVDDLPEPGQILSARGRQWLIENVIAGSDAGQSARLTLACLDDDAPGRPLEILWDLELGARVIAPESEGLGTPTTLDPPAHFGAYLHAIKWSAVSAADATRFQAPFRAGIELKAHQLTPLKKALELPRANLFIADDVGLGKTIEAGLVLQELILRQQAEFVLVVCPASICLQWRDEMMRRFGLRFEIMSRHFIGRRRVERGFGVNPWATHNRFIVSYPLIRRPDYRDPLLAHLGERAEKGLLILDEAHIAAPASASKYAVDTDTTRTVRDLAPKFDNRLFLSATPHNGHSNSFSALLEILDPVRFTRGVPIGDSTALRPVMVRRLKRDLREIGVESFPKRVLVRLDLTHDDGAWTVRETRHCPEDGSTTEPTPISGPLDGPNTELELSELLIEYTDLCSPRRGRGHLVFVNLQKRLLSSPEAFACTLAVHARALDRAGGVKVHERHLMPSLFDTESHGVDDEILAAEDDAEIAAGTRTLDPPTKRATEILDRMRSLAEFGRRRPDAKVLALFAWLRRHVLPGIGDPDGERTWTNTRVILFTEYADTKRYYLDLLTAAIAHTERPDDRILVYHGGMGDETRDEVQRAFNAPPAEHPVRILLATDAAREGVNLQAHCADVVHLDVPWNPSRLEQRNGRIDRILQPAPEVRCHYFVYPQRPEDRVLDTLVHKIETVQRELLGSVGAVLMEEMDDALRDGITDRAAKRIERIGTDARTRAAEDELEAQRRQRDLLEREIHEATQRLDRSRRALEVDPRALRGVLEVGLSLSGADRLGEGPPTTTGKPTFVLPALDRSWQETLDSLRPPRGRDQSFWDWRDTPPRNVTFTALTALSEDAEQIHLAHPLMRRVLDRFLAQGYGAHDLSRVSAVVVPGETVARVIAYARLTLFGHGAARLHDELIGVTAPWSPGDGDAVTPYRDADTASRGRESIEHALAQAGRRPSAKVIERILPHSQDAFAALWPHLEAEADAHAIDARNGLARRARKESDDLRLLLERQQVAVQLTIGDLSQTDTGDDTAQRRQVTLDLEHLATRESRIVDELVTEPAAIERLYEVKMTRLAPVGLVVGWPEAMT